jgi:hypothetical protein
MLATPPTVLCSLPLKLIVAESGKSCGSRFITICAGRRTGMGIKMKKLLSRFVVLILCVALIPCFGLSTVEKVIRPIGDTSRKNPLRIGETVITENNMYDEYTYSYTV